MGPVLSACTRQAAPWPIALALLEASKPGPIAYNSVVPGTWMGEEAAGIASFIWCIKDRKRNHGCMYPQIIQVLDCHFSIEPQGDLGILHFRKAAMDIGWIHTSQLILLPRVSKISHGGGVFVASWVVQRCWGRLPNIHYGLLRQNSSGLEFREPSQPKGRLNLFVSLLLRNQ